MLLTLSAGDELQLRARPSGAAEQKSAKQDLMQEPTELLLRRAVKEESTGQFRAPLQGALLSFGLSILLSRGGTGQGCEPL